MDAQVGFRVALVTDVPLRRIHAAARAWLSSGTLWDVGVTLKQADGRALLLHPGTSASFTVEGKSETVEIIEVTPEAKTVRYSVRGIEGTVRIRTATE
jgi:hypothetical protein